MSSRRPPVAVAVILEGTRVEVAGAGYSLPTTLTVWTGKHTATLELSPRITSATGHSGLWILHTLTV